MSNETDKILQDAKKQIDEILDKHVHVLLEEEERRHNSPIRNWIYKTFKSFLDIFGIEKTNLKKRKWVGLSDTNEQIQCFWDGSLGSGAKLMREMKDKHPLMTHARIGESRTEKALDKVAKIMRQTEIKLAPMFFAAYKRLREEIIGKGFGHILAANQEKIEQPKERAIELSPPRNGL